MREELVFDQWTPMSFKRALGQRKQPGIGYEEPVWVGDHARRLAAYKILQAYLDNSARLFLATDDERQMSDHREYGDAELIRDTVLAAMLGDSQEIVVPEAADFDPSTADPAEGADPSAEAAWNYQSWLRDLWDAERGTLKLVETERNAVGLGDGVYSIGWSPSKGRTRIRVWDPGFYFPVLDDGNEDDFPSTVHIAWEIPPTRPGDKLRIRRMTWRLGPIRPAVDQEVSLLGRTLTEEQLHPGDKRDPGTGRITRTYAWSDRPSDVTCYFSDGTWEVDVARARTIDDLDPEVAMYGITEDGQLARDLDLFIDFVPVVHVPNTVAVIGHYGRSALSKVLQILDDLANSDTDAQAASATSARPVMALEGGTLGRRAPAYNPGEVWELGTGKLTLIDTSKAIDAILKYIEFLLDRLSVNARTPDALLGRVKPSEVPSGVALQLGFGPLATMVSEMRLSRAEKYPILFRFLWRMSLAGRGAGVPTQTFEAQMQFGSYLPQDRAAAVDVVTKLRTATPPAISIETAVAILVAAGFPIEDATEEVRRIESRDFVGAGDLHTAIGSVDAALEYLQMDRPADVVDRPAAPEVIPGDPNTDPNAENPPLPGL